MASGFRPIQIALVFYEISNFGINLLLASKNILILHTKLPEKKINHLEYILHVTLKGFVQRSICLLFTVQ